MKRYQVAAIFENIADLLELSGAEPFRAGAYRRGARAVENLTEDLEKVTREGRLEEISGIGKALAQKIKEILTTGTCHFYEELRGKVPPGLTDLLEVPGVGARTARVIYERLGITNLADLKKAAEEHRLRDLPGIGAKKEGYFLEGINLLAGRGGRIPLGFALPLAQELAGRLRRLPGVERAEVAGSVRRHQETVGDIDLVAGTVDPRGLMEAFTTLPQVKEVLARDETTASLTVGPGWRVNLWAVPPQYFIQTWHHLTGSKEHNDRLQGLASGMGLKINEYGIFREEDWAQGENVPGPKPGQHSLRGTGEPRGSPEAGGPSALGTSAVGAGSELDTGEGSAMPWVGEGQASPAASRREASFVITSEKELYQHLGLPYIPPELREDRGEIEAAREGSLPVLVEEGDLRGDLHVHSTWSDGLGSIPEMAQAARRRGYEYLAITDHSKSLGIARGLNEEQLRQQMREIDRLNRSWEGFTILKGMEVDILGDSRLDIADDLLQELDLVIASIHTGFRQPAEQINRRLEGALKNPHVDIIAHPTGRLLARREGYSVDVDRLLELAARTGTALEINASPDRLDLCDQNARRAREYGIKLAIDTDSHSQAGLEDMKYGVAVARRGWLEKKDVLNTLELGDLKRWLNT
ncbi:MAG: helix-hairpin-helix domain-containing protein [Firmicutes bacterium]|nr:helix-hairpin-helix domain-containing protein [Bacillota bacterium]